MAGTINCFIPQRIIAGFRKRNTSTGRLSFLTFNDERGKMKFETSFNNWIDHDIPLEYYDNSSMTALYIGNAAGGCKSGWNFRQEYIQISDDRGITFEIPTEDFLELLDYSIVDHGIIKGEFVFGWWGNKLTIVSTEFPWYKDAKNYSNNINNEKITKVSQMIPGRTYKLKNYPWGLKSENDTYVFIGNLSTITNDLHKTKSRLTFFKDDSFFFTDIKNIEFEVKEKESLSIEVLNAIVERFEHSPYSSKWWKVHRFNSKITVTKTTTKKSLYDCERLYSTVVDEEGFIYTHAIQHRDIKPYYSRLTSYDDFINIKRNDVMNKSIQWFNIIKDENINIPLKFNKDKHRYCNVEYLRDDIDKIYVKYSLDPDITKNNWPEIKEFINKHTVDKHCDFTKDYICECDGYVFNLSTFVLDGFLWGTTGNFSVNEKYPLPCK